MTRRCERLASVVAVTALLLVALQCTAHAATPRRPPIAVRVSLSEVRVTAGTPIRGAVVFMNTSARRITVNECAANGWLQVALKSRNYTPRFPRTLVLCPPSIHLRPGVTRVPVTVSTSYGACLGAGGGSATPIPPCLSGNRLPPLPPGRYTTDVSISGLGNLTGAPRPVLVTVLRAGRGSP